MERNETDWIYLRSGHGAVTCSCLQQGNETSVFIKCVEFIK